MHVSSDFEHNLIGHNENRQYHLEQLKTLKQLARDHGYLGAGVTEGNSTRYLKLSKEPTDIQVLQLAAQKAPEGGMVSNNQFYPGGRFLPRALKSIREVRNRKLAGKMKLSRESDNLWENFHQNPHDDLARGMLTDHLEETGYPGLAEFIGNHAKLLDSDAMHKVLGRYGGHYDTYISPHNKKGELGHPNITLLRVSPHIHPHRVTLGSPDIGYWHGAPSKELADKIKSELMSPE